MSISPCVQSLKTFYRGRCNACTCIYLSNKWYVYFLSIYLVLKPRDKNQINSPSCFSYMPSRDDMQQGFSSPDGPSRMYDKKLRRSQEIIYLALSLLAWSTTILDPLLTVLELRKSVDRKLHLVWIRQSTDYEAQKL